MVNFFPGHSLERPDFKEPDFLRGVTPRDTAEAFRPLGQPDNTKDVIRDPAGASIRVANILQPQGENSFKEHRKSDKTPIRPLLHIALDDSPNGQEEFAHRLRLGRNMMLLEQSLRDNAFRVADAKEMIEILEEQRKNFVIQNITHADRLVQSYQKAQEIKHHISH